MDSILSDIKTKMQRSLEALAYEFNKIRTGRANPSILDSIKVCLLYTSDAADED